MDSLLIRAVSLVLLVVLSDLLGWWVCGGGWELSLLGGAEGCAGVQAGTHQAPPATAGDFSAEQRGAWIQSVGVLGGEDMLAPSRFWAVSLCMDPPGQCHARFISAVPQHGV